MLFNTTNKRVAKMMGDTGKIKNSRRYLKEVNKSVRNLYKDLKEEATGGKFNSSKATYDSMKEEARMQKRGFYRTAFSKAWNDNRLVQLSKEYTQSLSKALKTGKLYTREADMFEAAMARQNKVLTANMDPIQDMNSLTRSNATYDAAKAQISASNANAKSQFELGKIQTAETKMGFNRMASAMAVGTQQTLGALNSMNDYMRNVLKVQFDQSLQLDRERNAYLMEIRDLQKKMIINNDTYQKMSIEKDKGVVDLIMEGRFKDAFTKSGENLLNEFDKKQIVKIMSNSLPMMLQMAISNPMGFVKDMITGSDKFQRLKAGTDPKSFLEGQLNKYTGSKNGIISRAAKAIGTGGRKKLSDMRITNEYNKGAMQWSGIERKALVEVIPTYLRKILSAMTKTEELVYVYDDGNGNAGFTTKKDLRNKIDDFKNRDISGAVNAGSTLEKFYRKANKGADSPPFSFLLNVFAKEVAYSAIPNALGPIFLWSFSKWKELVPDTDFTQKTWKEMGTAATILLNSSDKELSDQFKKQLVALQRSIDGYRKEHYEFIDRLNQNADLSGMSSLVNNSDLYEPLNIFNPGGNNGGRRKKRKGGNNPPNPPKEDWEETKRKLFARSRYDIKDDQVDNIVNKRFGNDADKVNDYWDRLNSMSSKDFENAGIKLNAFHFKNWLKERHKNLTDEQRETLANLFKHERWVEIYKKVNDFSDYLDEVKFDHVNNLDKSMDSEVKKYKELKKLKNRQGEFNSAYTGLQNSFDSISKDPVKQEAATGMIKKMFTAGGVAAIAGKAGLIPLAGSLGLPGVLMAAMGGIGISMLSNRKELSQLILGGMDEDQKANLKKVTGRVVSKVMTGAGFAGVAGLGAAVLGAGPLAPIFAATAGVAAAINSDKSGFKRFFFGEEHDENKTFFQLFKTKMLGDKETNDDGLFGRFLNPVFERTAGLFDKFNENMEKNIFSPFKKWGKALVEKIDASTLGQKFKDAMGFSLTEFNDVMKKNVWGPLTKNIFGGIKKMFGWGRKHVDEFQANERAEYEMADSVTQRVEKDLQGNNPPDPNAASGARRTGNRRRNIFGYGGASEKVIRHRNGQDAQDIISAQRVGFKDLANLVGNSDSIPAKHYYSQYDPQYKDLKLGILGKSSTIEHSGCAVMVGAMIMSRFGKVSNENKKHEVTPKYLETTLIPLANKHYSVTGSGVKYEFFRDLANKFSMEYTLRKNKEMFSIAEIKKITAGNKGVVVVLVDQTKLGNHFIVITAVNGDRIYYDDPARKRNLVMTYEELCEGANLAMGISKTKGFFGVLGKIFSGVVNFLNGNAQKNKMARRWGIRREYIDRMTREEWNKYKNKSSIDQGFKDILVSRTPLMTNLDGSTIKIKGKAVEDRNFAETLLNNSINDQLSGKGAKKKGKSTPEKPKNAINEMPGKGQFPATRGNQIPGHLNTGIYFTNENMYRSLMLSATIHNTHVTNTMLGAIYTKLSEMEVTVFNGTNGVAYNTEHMKRMVAIKHFGSVKKADSAVGPIDETKLSNSRFFGNRSLGIKEKIGKGLSWIKSKTTDPLVLQYLIFKKVLGDFAKTYGKFLNPLWYIEKLGELSTKIIDSTWELGTNIVKTIGAGFKSAGKILGGALKGIGSTIGGAISGLGKTIGGFLEGIGSTLGGAVNGFFETVRSLPTMLSDTLEGITKTVSAAATGMVKLTSAFIGGVYGGAKTVVKDVWGAGKAIVKGVGNGIVNTSAWLKGGASAVRQAISDRTTTFVRVIGGHLDTVGSVGAIDRDSFLAALKGVRKASGDNTIGAQQSKNNKMNQTLDEEQDKASGVQDRQTELLELIANKEGGSGPGKKEDKKDNSWLSQVAKWLLPALALGPYLVKKLKEFFLDTTPDGHSTVNIPTKGDPASYIDYATRTGNFDLIRHGKGALALAKAPFKLAKMGLGYLKSGNFIDDAVKLPGAIKKGIVTRFKKLPGVREVNRMVTTGKRIGNYRKTDNFLKTKWGMSSAQVENARKGILSHAEDGMVTMKDGIYQKTSFVDEMVDGKLKMVPKTETFVDELLQSNAKEAAKQAAKKAALDATSSNLKAKWLNMGDKVSKYGDDALKLLGGKAKSLFAKVFGNTTLWKFLESNEKGLGTLVKEGMEKLVDKVITNPKVKAEIMKKGGAMLGRAVPFLNIAFLINDIYTGWRDADRYFNIPESKVTTKMRVISSLCRFVQGLVSLLPFMWWFSLLPTEWFTRMFWSMFGGKQKEQQKKDEIEFKEKYDAYHRENDKKGIKSKTYDDWIGSQGGKEDNIIKAAAKKVIPKADPKYSIAAAGAAGMYGTAGKKPGMPGYVPGGGNPYGQNQFTNKYAAGLAYGAEKGYLDDDGAPTVTQTKGQDPEAGGFLGGLFSGMFTKGKPGAYAFPSDIRTISSRALKQRWNPATKTWRPHKGIDLAAPSGSKVYSISDGKVVFAGWENPSNTKQGYGQYVSIQGTDGVISKYAHLSKVVVSTGAQVKKGQLIGYSGSTGGSTGPHLHFEMRQGLGKLAGVLNPEKYFNGFKYSRAELSKENPSNVYGPGRGGEMGAATGGNKLGKLSGLQTNLFGQNFNLNMSVGGDKMNLQEVGCGPVTANLFLQESGVRETLQMTAKNLRLKRDTGEGFSPDTLAKYINSRNAPCKLINKFDRTKLIMAKYAIVFAARNSIINSLDENHAMFIKNTSDLGAIIFDPFYEKTTFFTWDQIDRSAFEYIIPTREGINKTAKGGKRDLSLLTVSGAGRPAVPYAYEDIKGINKRVSQAMESRKVAGAKKSTTTTKKPEAVVVTPSVDNIKLESKLDTIINLLSQLVANTATSNTIKDSEKVTSGINKAMNALQNTISTPVQSEKQDAWINSRNKFSRGGI